MHPLVIVSVVCQTMLLDPTALKQGKEPVPQPEGYFIGFYEPPGPAEEQLVLDAGGTIHYVYHLIPVIATDLTSDAVEDLLADPRVEYAEKDCTLYALAEQYDWGVNRIDADQVHGYAKGNGVAVAILDSGIDTDHTDLQSNYRGGKNFQGADPPEDDYGHGTAVSGVSGAAINGVGLIGVAPELDLYAVKVLNATGSGAYSKVVAGIEWSVDNGMKIINISGGGDHQTSIERACNAAWDDGILIIAAAGNDPDPEDCQSKIYPANYENVVAVSATDDDDSMYESSCTGSYVELAAPGEDITTTWLADGYTVGSGTSASAPHVTGVAALIWACNPSMTNAQVRQRLQDTAEDLGASGQDDQYGYGLVDAEAAVTQAWVVTDVTPSTYETHGEPVYIYVQVRNDAAFSDTCFVTAYAEDEAVGTEADTLSAGQTKAITITWHPHMVGTYQISAEVHEGTCEGDASDNQFDDDYVLVVSTGTDVPTVSEWGLVIMTLLLLSVGTLVLVHRRSAHT